MDTFGVGTRIALPVSLPFSTGRALAAAVAAPVSVITMFSGALRTTTALVEVVDQVLVVGVR